ncbi:MAG: PBSX family phage terminase large subunit [Firmicutes bacterium HGW-Firmicutes-11]|jgi:PBSX family phage terminase large subunit|nr:MAG: PBSX family phage terminase large subunit [Firmicutes bacterium HGW-Firmicutes-19]PKM84476.1 MAG: PBSX family phage terminase large subunit [Firmicutes bacterium HGW-Firmicutes-11]
MLTSKQREFIKEARRRWNIKIGATRSGKTWLDFNYRIPAKTRELSGLDGLYVIMGVTQQTVERNVLRPMRDVYGEDLVGMIQTGRNTVKLFGETYFVLGAEKISSLAKVQGMSIKYCYGDEMVRWNQEVFAMVQSRLDKTYSCFDGTGNPEGPNHWLKKFLDSGADVFHQRYTIDDNNYLDPVFVANLKREYAGTVYYDRYILGLWAMAEGRIYKVFGPQNKIPHVSWYEQDEYGNWKHPLRKNVMYVQIGVDFGGTKSSHAFNATAVTRNFKELITVKEKRITKEITPEELDRAFIDFVKEVMDEYKVIGIRADSAEQVLIRGLKMALIKHQLPVSIDNATKGVINDRIRFYISMMNRMKYFIVDSCKETIEAYETAVWDSDSQEDERLDDGTTNIDNLDAQEYSTEPWHKTMIDLSRR